MLAAFVILFREVLEMAVIISIVLAATRGVAGRGKWIGAGVAGGVAGSAVVAAFASEISDAMAGMGQELFNGLILSIAVVMIVWTVVWMKSHGRQLAQRINHIGKQVSEGELPLHALAVVVVLSMWREGAEVVLFMTGMVATAESLSAIIMGAVAGASVAALLGGLLYFGLIKLTWKHMFTVTTWLLVLLACGLSAQAAGYFVAAGVIPELFSLWDTSAFLPQSSVAGSILHAMIGYVEQPSAMQALWYVACLLVILCLQKLQARPRHTHSLQQPKAHA